MYPPSTFRITDETTIYPSSIYSSPETCWEERGVWGTGEEDEGGERIE